jgi:2-polyprenyl-6-hydroxyphenyl methylase/3-demethylubiquinone-9 3-methyltransferase
MNSTLTTVSPDEIKKFELMSKDWWNPLGKFKPLHELTPVRLEYIINLTKRHFIIDSIESLKVLDIGCGGGLISEPMARLKADITGIDASSLNIEIAKAHAIQNNLEINYRQILAEDLVKEGNKYKLVLALEVIEHVENIELFIKTCSELIEPGGLIIFSTINQTVKSFFQAIIAAEYILNWVPIGTHSWTKFVKPSYISRHARENHLQLLEIQGLSYKILSKEWSLSQDISNNYFIAFSA